MEIDTSRIRTEDAVGIVAAYVLLASIFLPWYRVGTGWLSGWDATKLSIVLLSAALIAILVEIATSLGIDFTEEYAVLLFLAGAASLTIVIIRIFVRQAGLQPTYGLLIAVIASASLMVSGIVKLIRLYLPRRAAQSI